MVGRISGTIDIDFGKQSEWNGLTFYATAPATFASLASISSSGTKVKYKTALLDRIP